MQDFVDCWLCLNVHCQPSPGFLNVGPPRIKMWRPTYTRQHRRRRSSSFSHVMWMIFRWRIKNLLLFLVWWFKLFLIPGIHEGGEKVSIENNSRENQSTLAVLCKDVADEEGISNLISRHYLCFMSCPFPPSINFPRLNLSLLYEDCWQISRIHRGLSSDTEDRLPPRVAGCRQIQTHSRNWANWSYPIPINTAPESKIMKNV